MFWQEDDSEIPVRVPDDIVDILFSLDCKRLPVDHAYALSSALRQAVPWIGDGDSGVAVHTIHVAGSQNGWERPEHGTDRHLILSKRTKLAIRVSKEHIAALVKELEGKILLVSGSTLTVGPGKIRPLSKETTLLSRYVVGPTAGAVRPDPSTVNVGDGPAVPTPDAEMTPDNSEEAFLSWAVQTLSEQGIRIRKALCGKTTHLAVPGGMLHTRSLMLADLSVQESVRLQQQGLGPHRQMGCGIFIPHKGIDAVGKTT